MGSCVFQGELSLDCDFRRVTDIRTVVHSGLGSRHSRVRMYVLSSYADSWKKWNVLGRILGGDFIPAARGKTRHVRCELVNVKAW